MDYHPISKERQAQQTFDDFVRKFDNLYNQAKDKDAQSEIIKRACKQLIDFNDPSKTEIFLDHFKQKHGVKKTLMNDVLNRLYQENKGEDTTKVIPQITLIERFLQRHFDIHFNEISNKYYYKKKKERQYKEFNEFNVIRFMRKNHISYSRAQLIELIKSDFIIRYNPIRHYFETLPEWDGKDYIEELSSYVILEHEKEDRERFSRHMKKMFVRAIAGAMSQDFNKRAMIFVGGQDSGKTTFQRWLCPPELQSYCTENIDFSNKDGLRSLSDNFWIILDELAEFPRNDINTVKSIMSRAQIKIRLPYDRNESILHRRCSFIGNTNDREFLTDPTGNVRWICFEIKDINWDYQKDIDINKVWGQAYHLFESGNFKYDLTREELKENEFINSSFKIETEEMNYVRQFMSPVKPVDKDIEPAYLTSTQVAEDLMEKTKFNKKFNSVSIGRALSNLNFERKSQRNENNIPIKVWKVFKL
jgi:hypothetical protein